MELRTHTDEKFLSTAKDPPKLLFMFTQHVKLTIFVVFDVYFITAAQNKYFFRCGHARCIRPRKSTRPISSPRGKKCVL